MRNWTYRSIIFLLILFVPLVSKVCYSDGYKNDVEVSCSAMAAIEDRVAHFRFPILTATRWTWYRYATKDSRLEYSWSISLGDSDSHIYDFGAYLFKFPGSTQQEGTLETLVSKMQHSIFDRSGKLKAGFEINANVEDGVVVVSVDDSKTFDALFQSRPPYAYFRIRIPDGDPVLCEAKIDYLPGRP